MRSNYTINHNYVQYAQGFYLTNVLVAVGSHNSATKTHGKWEGAEI